MRNNNVGPQFGLQYDTRPPFHMPFAGVSPPLAPYPRPTQGTEPTTGVTTFSIPTIPTMPPKTIAFSLMHVPPTSAPVNGDSGETSHRNGFFFKRRCPSQDSGFDPVSLPTSDNFNLDNLVARMLKQLEEHNEKMLLLLAKLPRAVVPVDFQPMIGFQASAFVDEIAMVDVPKKFNILTFTSKYSGIRDPTDHITQYKQLMWIVSIVHQYQEACMCKSFGVTLTGTVL
ncbi:hypothetical protein L6452_37277 [Arctium lappa]|uniref:Uncharacterized protein n=1 Tax=Arctium lappa TaxID=4217 RepID=A0ACB8Y3K5_ARCLA|nr:hypothetical protein L6452_37277 [Arctium lappa]